MQRKDRIGNLVLALLAATLLALCVGSIAMQKAHDEKKNHTEHAGNSN